VKIAFDKINTGTFTRNIRVCI